MSKIVQNLINLLELPGLSNLVKGYTKTSVNVDNKHHLNRKQFQTMEHIETKTVFSYGDLELTNPANMFNEGSIKTFTSKGLVTLIEDSSHMFSHATSFNSDLSRWNVTNMRYMFVNATSFNSDLSRWNVENVIIMGGMFYEAISFNSDLSKWDVKNVRIMSFMFADTDLFDSDLSRWNVENVSNMRHMFSNATSFNSDLRRWNVGKVLYKDYILDNANSFDTKLSPKYIFTHL